jgi:thioredoxin-related protein
MPRSLSVLMMLLGLHTWQAHASAPRNPIAVAHDLQRDARQAQREHSPVLIVFTRPHCAYCDRVIDYYLIPMQRHADAAGPVLIRQMDMTSSRKLVDFDGRKTTQRAFAHMLKVDFAPTVMVFTPDGKPGAKPLVGLGPEDYYGGYLDRAIEQARGKMRAGPR